VLFNQKRFSVLLLKTFFRSVLLKTFFDYGEKKKKGAKRP
jgi:hypothetical protein